MAGTSLVKVSAKPLVKPETVYKTKKKSKTFCQIRFLTSAFSFSNILQQLDDLRPKIFIFVQLGPSPRSKV